MPCPWSTAGSALMNSRTSTTTRFLSTFPACASGRDPQSLVQLREHLHAALACRACYDVQLVLGDNSLAPSITTTCHLCPSHQPPLVLQLASHATYKAGREGICTGCACMRRMQCQGRRACRPPRRVMALAAGTTPGSVRSTPGCSQLCGASAVSSARSCHSHACTISGTSPHEDPSSSSGCNAGCLPRQD